MDAKRFYSVPYEGYADYGIAVLGERYGTDVAYGKWHILLGLLYDADGIIDIGHELTERTVCGKLCFENVENFREFLELLAFVGYIDARKLAEKSIVNKGVCDEFAFRAQSRENGQRGGRPGKRP